MENKATYVDTHFHIWELNRYKYRYPPADLGPIYRDFTIEEYKDTLTSSPIDNAIFVQVEPNHAAEETEWLLDLSKTFSFIKGVVAGFPLGTPDFASQIDKFCEDEKFVGVRNILPYESDTYILSDAALAGMSVLVEKGLPYDILAPSPTLRRNILQLLNIFPNHTFVVNHLGFAFDKMKENEDWDEWIAQVARYPNVNCKVSSEFFKTNGELTEAQKQGKFTQEDRKYINRVLEVFGVERLVYGSNWPVSRLTGLTTLQESCSTLKGLLDHLTSVEQDKIFGANAARIYNLKL